MHEIAEYKFIASYYVTAIAAPFEFMLFFVAFFRKHKNIFSVSSAFSFARTIFILAIAVTVVAVVYANAVEYCSEHLYFDPA